MFLTYVRDACGAGRACRRRRAALPRAVEGGRSPERDCALEELVAHVRRFRPERMGLIGRYKKLAAQEADRSRKTAC